MRTVLLLVLAFAMQPTAGARAASEWQEVCDTVGRFSGIIASERDRQADTEFAIGEARAQLHPSAVLTQDVADEITREIYANAALSPNQAHALMRSRCLAVQAFSALRSDRPPAQSGPAPSMITQLRPIELHSGINRIDHFVPGGGPAEVRLTWQNDGAGRGHDVFTASVPEVGPIAMPDGGSVRDEPDNDYDMSRSVRFALGQISGEQTGLLLVAARQPGTQPTATVFRVYRVAQDGGGYRFTMLSEQTLPAAFCNADMALSAASGLPLRISYRGPLTPNGCPQPPAR